METDNRTAFVDVAELIDQQPVSRFQIRVIALCAGVVFMDGFDTQAIGYVAPTLGKLWNLKPGALGPVFGAGLFGLMLGALIGGPLADRIGRKRVIILSTLAFGLCSLLTVTADSLNSLLLWRLATGLGLGGAMPNAIALTSEYSPQRSRATLVMIMFCGFSLGSALGGVFAARLIPSFGWTAVFWLGGILPIALSLLLVLALPESIRLLALRGSEDRRIRTILAHIAPALSFAAETRFVAREERLSGFTVRHLFGGGRALGTALLWVMFFMNLLDLYFLANWLPTVISNAGIAVEIAVIITTLLQIGGVAGAVSGRRLSRRRPADCGDRHVRRLACPAHPHRLRRRLLHRRRADRRQCAVGILLSDGDPLDGRRLGPWDRPHRLDHRSRRRRHHLVAALANDVAVPDRRAAGLLRRRGRSRHGPPADGAGGRPWSDRR